MYVPKIKVIFHRGQPRNELITNKGIGLKHTQSNQGCLTVIRIRFYIWAEYLQFVITSDFLLLNIFMSINPPLMLNNLILPYHK